MGKEYTSKDLRKDVSTKKDHFVKPKCAITHKTEITAPLQVDHIVECQAVAVCLNLLRDSKLFSTKKIDELVQLVKDEWINSELFLKK